jgi:septum formation protein
LLAKELILASSSDIRKKILDDNGISYIAKNHNFDEKILKSDKALSPDKLSLKLARGKAMSLRDKFFNHVVLGCDQVCLLKDRIFSKPLTVDKAVNNLSILSGQTHQLIGSYVFIKNGDVLYEETITTNMTMRSLTKKEIVDYVELDQPFKSCGSYMFEKNGYKLFSEVEGSLEAINGMPINYLLENLEKHV